MSLLRAGRARGGAVALAAASVAVLAACAVVVPGPHAAGPRVVYRDMPAPVAEVIPRAPAPGLHWVPGHYVWQDGAWRWHAGHYVRVFVPPMPAPLVETPPVAPSAAYVYVRGHWRWGGAGWIWVRGAWVPG
jgi:hypothetical protein